MFSITRETRKKKQQGKYCWTYIYIHSTTQYSFQKSVSLSPKTCAGSFFFFLTRQTEILLTWIHPTQDVPERLRKYTISKGKCIVTTTKVHRLKWNQRQIDHENIIMLFSFVHLWLRLFELFYCLFRLVEQRLFHLVSIIRRIQFLGSLKHTSLYIVLNSD